MEYKNGQIEGVVIKPLRFFKDQRGWLSEIYRNDELHMELHPSMAYMSMTVPGVTRGPHEHVEQTDYFVFISSSFKVSLWDSRKASPTYGNSIFETVAASEPKVVIVPPGVVHAYTNIGTADGIVLNLPNSLFLGWGKKGWRPETKIDEIRHEDDPNSPFKVD